MIKTVILSIVALIIGFGVGIIYEWIREEKILDIMEDKYKKMTAFYKLLIQWLALKQEGISLAKYFEQNNYHTVAIYGMKELGERLLEELDESDIKVVYIIDQNADKIETSIPKYRPMDDLPDVDVIVVSAVYAFQDIQETMEKNVNMPIISLEDVVYGLA